MVSWTNACDQPFAALFGNQGLDATAAVCNACAAGRFYEAPLPWNRMHHAVLGRRCRPVPYMTIPTATTGWRRRAAVPRADLAANIHPVLTEGLSPQYAATAYETTLKQFYGADTLDLHRPLFDVTLLGIGEDGTQPRCFSGRLHCRRSNDGRWRSSAPRRAAHHASPIRR